MKLSVRRGLYGGLAACILAVFALPELRAEEGGASRGQAAASPGAGRTASDNDLRIQGVFNTVLPGTEKKHALRLVVHPHVGDLVHEDHLRVPLGLRYGFSSRLQLNAGIEPYFSHGLGEVGFFKESGLNQMRLGGKYSLGEHLVPGFDLAVGIDWIRPVGRPPAPITDGMEHVAPFVSFAHWLDDDRSLRLFGSITYDSVEQLRIPRHLEKNELGEDALEFTVGVLRQRGPVTYTFETGYATTRFTSQVNDDVFMIRPGLVWVVPDRYTFWATGKWLLGSSVRLGYGPDGVDVGVGVKLRISLDLKRVVGRRRD